MQKFTYVIKEELGIHARPAGLLVKEAKQFSSTITIECGNKKTNAKGLIGVMGMGIKKGNEVTVVVEGNDEEVAITAMKIFLEKHL